MASLIQFVKERRIHENFDAILCIKTYVVFHLLSPRDNWEGTNIDNEYKVTKRRLTQTENGVPVT